MDAVALVKWLPQIIHDPCYQRGVDDVLEKRPHKAPDDRDQLGARIYEIGRTAAVCMGVSAHIRTRVAFERLVQHILDRDIL